MVTFAVFMVETIDAALLTVFTPPVTIVLNKWRATAEVVFELIAINSG